MGKLINGFEGLVVGRVGSLVTQRCSGVNVVKSYCRHKNVVPTPDQAVLRSSFSDMAKDLRVLWPLMDNSFFEEYGEKISWPRFQKQNWSVFVVPSSDATIDKIGKKAICSRGSMGMPNVVFDSVLSNNSVKLHSFTYQDDGASAYSRYDNLHIISIFESPSGSNLPYLAEKSIVPRIEQYPVVGTTHNVATLRYMLMWNSSNDNQRNSPTFHLTI